ncbi:4'-phosphopantetheinyl transferase superfamily protein [Micromonospora sp. ATCC 39149]|uniref:4'-phosphopantetheinyl transferase superfamily protein n=1 Tax=Micromonospora carbonacea TaxID=47853 RepID=A0A7D6GFU3_9ACTN|nr:4'-phosphopantetheinyl transferase family protein [Micromonospora sp. ATCC 39149]QLK00625.1 4'-phosphopantetheinyl transferase superfamily protein [Micromonospora carbonacea]
MLRRKEGDHRGVLCVTDAFDGPRGDGPSGYLHPEEAGYLAGLRYPKRRGDYLIGRYVGKRAVAALVGEPDPAGFRIDRGVFGHPVVRGTARAGVQVSITHNGPAAAAVAFDEAHPMGVDLEQIDESRLPTLLRQLSGDERALVDQLGLPLLEAAVRLWSARESLTKAMRTGLTVPMPLLEVSAAVATVGCVRFEFRNFFQFAAMTVRIGAYCLALALPRYTRLDPLTLPAGTLGSPAEVRLG